MVLILIDRGLALCVSEMVRPPPLSWRRRPTASPGPAPRKTRSRSSSPAAQRVFFTEGGYRYDLVDAALAVDWDMPLSAQRRLDALVEARDSGLLARLYTGFERCHNLSRGRQTGSVDEACWSRRASASFPDPARGRRGSGSRAGHPRLQGRRRSSRALCAPVDRLFDEVLIMADDQAVRTNRLSLLARVDALFNRVADFPRLTWD